LAQELKTCSTQKKKIKIFTQNIYFAAQFGDILSARGSRTSSFPPPQPSNCDTVIERFGSMLRECRETDVNYTP
jgi:hypothetical protein